MLVFEMKLIYTKDRRLGFTLMELLLVISILAVLSTMALAVMASATDDAKAAATQSRIAKVEAMLQTELERYEVRRLPVSLTDLQSFAGTNSLIVVRNLKRQIIADILSAEMPRPNVDVNNNFQPMFNTFLGFFPTREIPIDAQTGYDVGFNQWLEDNYTALHGELSLDRYDSASISYFRNKFNPPPATGRPPVTMFDNPGEYLYEILSRIDVDGASGVEAMGNASIGDSDEDTIPEIVDAWGNPMWMRILQVRALETPPGSGNWVDQETNWDAPDPTNFFIPEGYEILNPTIPRPLDKIRFQVISPRLFGIAQ